ncbi:MAG: DEAD/DEAH box helicase [Bdellovibrionales bacterium]|nr:DEAD/DEAH box helicase [Bdellovibrionales bacterium]
MAANVTPQDGFRGFSLIPALYRALDEVGYETPSPIQAQTIPLILEGGDIVGQAQTGTGKTAAFALPLLSRINLALREPQVLVLTPTRELAIQVAEAFQRYAAYLDGFHVLPIYGGQEYGTQLRQLKRGPQVVVGTPGRVMDHMRRKTLRLDALVALVLDEADEMLRMGFIEDVEWILSESPKERQVALFSATMPKAIRHIAQQHLKNPRAVTVQSQARTAAAINQRFLLVSQTRKLDALTRILEAEPFDAALVFVRTKTATLELDEKLRARGYASAALNGDIAQRQREATVERLKSGKLDILVATDVAARGLDIERVSHVVNFDIPNDIEAYVHRIGRTGRAGREGDAILFVTPRERRMLEAIERSTRQRIARMELPTAEQINVLRVAQFKQKITEALETEAWKAYAPLIEEYEIENDVPAAVIAAALAGIAQGEEPLLLEADRPTRREKFEGEPTVRNTRGRTERAGERELRPRLRARGRSEEGMETFYLDVGRIHGVRPGNIVGAIANEAGLDSADIGNIQIGERQTTIDLPQGMPEEIFHLLKNVWVAGRQLGISRGKVVPMERKPRRNAPGKDERPRRGLKHKHKQKPRKGGRRG